MVVIFATSFVICNTHGFVTLYNNIHNLTLEEIYYKSYKCILRDNQNKEEKITKGQGKSNNF